jgi:hypothetical protein
VIPVEFSLVISSAAELPDFGQLSEIEKPAFSQGKPESL